MHLHYEDLGELYHNAHCVIGGVYHSKMEHIDTDMHLKHVIEEIKCVKHGLQELRCYLPDSVAINNEQFAKVDDTLHHMICAVQKALSELVRLRAHDTMNVDSEAIRTVLTHLCDCLKKSMECLMEEAGEHLPKYIHCKYQRLFTPEYP